MMMMCEERKKESCVSLVLVSLGRVSLSPPLLIHKKPKETEREGKKEARQKKAKKTPLPELL
jgi:hypothetical protein